MGQQTGRLSARPSPPLVAMIVGTTPMIAIPGAAFMGSVAMIVGPAPQARCNDFGRGRPMIAISAADDCGSLHLLGKWLRGLRARAHVNTVVVALANKLARIAWAILRTGQTFEAREAVATAL